MNNDFAYNLPYTSSKWLNDTYNPMYDAIFQPIKGGNFLNGAKYTQNCLAVQQEPFFRSWVECKEGLYRGTPINCLTYYLKLFAFLGNSLRLTPNTPLIQLWCARSKLNMDEICSLNIHLWYVDNFYWNPLLNLQSPFLWSRKIPKKALRMEELQNIF